EVSSPDAGGVPLRDPQSPPWVRSLALWESAGQVLGQGASFAFHCPWRGCRTSRLFAFQSPIAFAMSAALTNQCKRNQECADPTQLVESVPWPSPNQGCPPIHRVGQPQSASEPEALLCGTA